MTKSEYVKQWKENRKSNGLCVGCGKPIDRNGVYCTKCREKINKTIRERRQWYLSHKICPRCGKNDLMGNETRCLECRAKEVNNALKNRNKSTYNSYHNEWAKSTYQKRKEAGVCTRCGKRKATEGYTTCAMCRERGNASRRARNGVSDRSERIEKGICYFCDNPVKTGYKVCEKHYQMNVEKAARGRETHKAQEYIKNVKKIKYRSFAHGKKDDKHIAAWRSADDD